MIKSKKNFTILKAFINSISVKLDLNRVKLWIKYVQAVFKALNYHTFTKIVRTSKHHIPHEDLGDVNIQIVDAFGRTVKSISGINVTRNGKIKIGTNDLINGCYEIILSSEVRITQKKIVIFR